MLKTLPSIRAQIATLPGLPEANRPYFESSLIDLENCGEQYHTHKTLPKEMRRVLCGARHGVLTSFLLKHKGVLVTVHSAATHA